MWNWKQDKTNHILFNKSTSALNIIQVGILLI